jgi:hypothetical protein
MNDPLREIEDIAVRDAIDIFQTYIGKHDWKLAQP